MASYNKKKRSFVAGIIGFIGSIVLVWGLYLILSEAFTMVTTDGGSAGRIILGILVIILSVFIQYGSFMYDKLREHKKWVKRLYSAGIVDELPSSKDLAWRAYRSNPTSMGLSFIEQHNPKAAADIRRHIEANSESPIEKLFGSLVNKQSKNPKKVVDEPVRIAVQQPELKTAPAKKPAPAQTTAQAPVKKPAPPAEKKAQPAQTAAQKTPVQKTQPVKQTSTVSQDTQVVKTTASEPRQDQPVRKIPSLAKDKKPPKKTFKEKVTEKLNVIALAVIRFFKKTGANVKSAFDKAVKSVKALAANLSKPAQEEPKQEETIEK